MFSPIVQEEKGCLTTFEEKKQKEAVKCFGSQVIFVVYIFDGIGPYKGTWALGFPLHAAGPCIKAPWGGHSRPDGKALICDEWKCQLFEGVGNISQSPPLLSEAICKMSAAERAREHLPSPQSLRWRPPPPPPPPPLTPLRAERNANRAFLSP